MGPVLSMSRLRVALAVALVGVAAMVLSACSTRAGGGNPNLVAGKQVFVAKCGSCHVLGRAQTKGNVGPNLDESFQQALKDGFGRDGIRGAVHGWILHPNPGGQMPAKVVDGAKAYDVAAYVAASVAAKGKESGLLAVEKAGAIEIDADPGGQLAYVTTQGSGTAGKLTVKMGNKSGTPHNIVIDGKGKGPEVSGGKVSSFSATFAKGTYTFYCSVPGHRAAGMQGKITIK
jgi:plastocyanin/predicted small secreted protein